MEVDRRRTAKESNLGLQKTQNIPYNEIKNYLNLLPTDKSTEIMYTAEVGDGPILLNVSKRARILKQAIDRQLKT